MKVALSLNFNPDHDSKAIVTAIRKGEIPVAIITFDFCAGVNKNEHQIAVQVVQEGGLAHYEQAKLILAASTLVDSIFTGEDAPSVVNL